VFSDEGLYMLVGRNLASGGGLVADRGIFFWHPPLYMVAEAIYLRAIGLLRADPLQTIFTLRWLNVFFSGVTAGVLLILGYRLHRSLRVGVLMAALFTLDPFVQRINRRSMLETLAMLLTLIAVTIYFTHRPRPSFWQQLGAGVALGLAILTKEIMAFELLVFVAYALWARRNQIGDALRVAGVACATYLVYPAWALAIGEGDRFLAYKAFGINRLLRITGTGIYLPLEREIRLPAGGRPPFLENLLISLGQYFSTYVLLGLGVVATAVLLVRYRHFQGARYAATWAVASYGIATIGVVGRLGDQFFYYVLVPALAVTGYALALLLSRAVDPLANRPNRPNRPNRRKRTNRRTLTR